MSSYVEKISKSLVLPSGFEIKIRGFRAKEAITFATMLPANMSTNEDFLNFLNENFDSIAKLITPCILEPAGLDIADLLPQDLIAVISEVWELTGMSREEVGDLESFRKLEGGPGG